MMDVQESMRTFFHPRSVAFIGLPRKTGPGSFNPIDHLKEFGYRGRTYLVHPHVREIGGFKAFPDVRSIGEEVELAVIATPRETTLSILKDCIERNIRAVILVNQGFADADRAGKRMQAEIVETSRRAGIRVLGPNTLGVVNAFQGFTTSFMPLRREPSPVGVACQSGIFFVGAPHLVGSLGKGIDLGNSCDIDFVDSLEYFGDDPEIRVIALHIEGIRRARRFLEVARRVSTKKPIVALKTGRTEQGAKAAASHSGSLAGMDELYGAAFLQSGVVRAERTEELRDLTRSFLRLPQMKGNRIAVITPTGGGGIVSSDLCWAEGLTLASLPDRSLQAIRGLSPSWMPLSNPTDIWPAVMKYGMDPVYGKALEGVLKEPRVNAVLCIAIAPIRPEQSYLSALEAIQEASEGFPDKPIVVWLYGPNQEENLSLLESRGRAMAFPTIERAIRVLALKWKYDAWVENASR